MRHLLLVLILMLVSLSVSAANAADWAIEPFVVSYKVDVGLAKAESIVSLNSLGDERFEIVSNTRVTGFVGFFKRGNIDERAVFRYVDGEILAESLVREDNLSAEPRSCEVYYRPNDNEATVIFEGKEEVVSMPRNTFNPLLMQIALMQDMAENATPASYNILDHAGLKQFDVSIGTQEQIKTSVGKLGGVPVDLTNKAGNAGTRMWVVPEQNWLAVIVEASKDNEVKATLRATDIR